MAKRDPYELAAEARTMLQGLHQQNNVVVKFVTDESEYAEDKLTKADYDEDGQVLPGRFTAEKGVLTLNLDKLVSDGKAWPTKLDSIEDWREFPVLAGVAANQAGHARWSQHDELPDSIPNPNFDPAEIEGPGNKEWFPVADNGELQKLAEFLEEPRVERLGTGNFTKTWRKAMTFSASHLILEQVDAMDGDDTSPLDTAARLAIIVGGRVTAGTLGNSPESRAAVKKILDSAQSIIEKAVSEFEPKDQTVDPFHKIMGIVNKEIFNNDHAEATSHLEAARQVLEIIHPETKDDPDKDPEGEDGEGAGSDPTGALAKLAAGMTEGIQAMAEEMAEEVKREEENKDEKNDQTSGYGSVIFNNPRAPKIDHHEQPTAADRELYKRATEWMLRQIEPTVSETSAGQWLPVGGARLNVRGMIRDNLAGHKLAQRSDWDKSTQSIKPAPPAKVAIMLDGSGSMGRFARQSAAIAWASANAAANLPESRTASVVYGDAAALTQAPGHLPARTVAVSNTNGGSEAFIQAAEIIEEALWLNDEVEEGEKSNVLIIIVSDIMYGASYKGERQIDGFIRITNEWLERGYKIVIVGADDDLRYPTNQAKAIGKPFDRKMFEVLQDADQLFKD